MDARTRSAYLARLGLHAEPPSVEALQRLVGAHLALVPYETVWIHLGERWDIDPLAAAERVAFTRRGGYCYHLNGALGALLEALDYTVVRHSGGVHGPDGPDEAAMGNHLVLTVEGLPAAGNPGGRWYVDAGLGDGPIQALPLVSGTYPCGSYTYTLDRSPAAGDWALTHDPKGTFTGMAWADAPAGPEVFAARHVQLSTSPESGFVRVCTVQRRHERGATILRGRVLARVAADGPRTVTIDTASEWFALLADEFGLTLRDVGAPERAALWRRVSDAHAAHVAQGAS